MEQPIRMANYYLTSDYIECSHAEQTMRKTYLYLTSDYIEY